MSSTKRRAAFGGMSKFHSTILNVPLSPLRLTMRTRLGEQLSGYNPNEETRGILASGLFILVLTLAEIRRGLGPALPPEARQERHQDDDLVRSANAPLSRVNDLCVCALSGQCRTPAFPLRPRAREPVLVDRP